MAGLSKDFYKMYSLLSAWYGREQAREEITAYTPKAESIGDVASKILKKTASPDIVKANKVSENWESIVGPQIARIASPLNFREKILCVQVSHSVWMRELQTGPSKTMILKKVNELLGSRQCKDIQFIPGGR
jgi:predicted nucleic acid-binding Zn ribbon protein